MKTYTLFEILSKTILAESNSTRITKLEIFAPHICTQFLPGQFVIVMVNDHGERIPLTIVDTSPEKNSIILVFQEIGFTTKLLGKLNPGEKVYHIVGPLGKTKFNEFISEINSIILIGGGVGTAEIYPVAKMLASYKKKVITIIGAKSKNMVILSSELQSVSDELYISTDDGSYGEKGFVTDVLSKILSSNKKEQVDLVYAVGPMIMMKNVSELTKSFNIKTIVSLNTIMVDGTGMCGSCRVTVDGKIYHVCCDGPEFDGHKIDWDELIKRNNLYLTQEKLILKYL